MTLENLGKEMVDLIPSLAIYAPPARIIDKSVNSPWLDGALEVELQQRGADSLIITGGETDVCVLATVLRAIDRGYRIVIATDALCSSSDETHEALLKVYAQRYGQQIETATSAQILHNWRL
jgi:nicotinamidase-related amidase